MSASAKEMISPSGTYNASVFWERLWRMSGINFLVFLIVAYFIHGPYPRIAAIVAGMAVLNLLWFAAALKATLSEAGRDGWGSAATASSAALGALFFLLIAMAVAIGYAGSEANSLVAGLNDLAWASVVLSSFPRAMLIMAGTFGFWRAGIISNALFAAGVAVVVLVLVGGATWAGDGFWAPDGAYSRLVSPLASIAWLLVASRILLTRSSTPRSEW
jgi:hypothetical protein